MSSKESNEVTIKVMSTKEELIKILTDKEFKKGNYFIKKAENELNKILKR